MGFSEEEKDKIEAIYQCVWLLPSEFKDKLLQNVGNENLKIQLKGKKNRFAIITDLTGDDVRIRYVNDSSVTVPISKIAGFTTSTDWYRQRKAVK